MRVSSIKLSIYRKLKLWSGRSINCKTSCRQESRISIQLEISLPYRARISQSNTPWTFSNPPPYSAKLSNTPRLRLGVFESLASYGGGFEKVRGVFELNTPPALLPTGGFTIIFYSFMHWLFMSAEMILMCCLIFTMPRLKFLIYVQ